MLIIYIVIIGTSLLIIYRINHIILSLKTANEQDFVGYEIGNCNIGQEYAISVASYCEPKSFQKDDRKVTCGCSSLPSQQIQCAPVSPPKSPTLFIKSINTFGVEIIWERSREYSSAVLSVGLCIVFPPLFFNECAYLSICSTYFNVLADSFQP